MCQSRDMTYNTRKDQKISEFLEHGRFSQKLIIRFSLNSPDSKKGTRVTYCESLDEFLCAKVEI